jgi:hypothetical protein
VVGDFPVVPGATTSRVPSFGTVTFSSALINGYPFGSAGTGLQVDNLYASSAGSRQAKTAYSMSNKEAFTRSSSTPDNVLYSVLLLGDESLTEVKPGVAPDRAVGGRRLKSTGPCRTRGPRDRP